MRELRKLEELRKTNQHISDRIRSIKNDNKIDEQIKFFAEVIHHCENDVTSTNIYTLKKGMRSNILSSEVFNRVICIKGKLKISFIPFKDEVIITTPNTQLILPETKYILEALEDCEIISIYKKTIGERLAISEHQTIYSHKKVENG